EAHRIDAVALAGRRRAVGEDMALVRAAAGADDFRSDHAVAGVANVFQVVGAERLSEARPAGAAFELGAAVEQREAAEPAGEDSGPLLVEEDPAERRFGAMFEEDVFFLVVELGDQRVELALCGRCEIECCFGGWSVLGHGESPQRAAYSSAASNRNTPFVKVVWVGLSPGWRWPS